MVEDDNQMGKVAWKQSPFMVALWNRTDHYIFILWFLLLSIFFFSRRISLDAHWMSTILPHMVWLKCESQYSELRLKRAALQVWNVRHAAKMQDPKKSPKIAIWAPSHNFVGLYTGWQWRNFFISAVFRHFVGQGLRNVCYSGVSRRHFLNNIAIVPTFS